MKRLDVRLGDYSLDNVTAPETWSDRAIRIAARTYFAPGETSIFQMVQRVTDAITDNGYALGYFPDVVEKNKFAAQLSEILLTQKAAFNTPVWMNIGVAGREPQAWACLILGVDDSMDSISRGWDIEKTTFKGGSGSGVNVSKVRAKGEPLSDGAGVGSGPISLWMRPTDSIAGVVRSGGRTRRAAKMVIMDADHPEIEAFVQTKANAENMARVLKQNGFDITMQGDDSANIPFQNANNSVRVTDQFMDRVADDEEWELTYRTTGEVAKTIKAKELWKQIAQAAWECGDPGVQFHDTINAANPVYNDGEIIASNPCSEYMFLDNTVCNLASINLVQFDRQGDIAWGELAHTVQVMTTAMDILVDLSSYPTPEIGDTSRKYRTLGLGFTNLGAYLMRNGIPYESEEGRARAATIQAFIQATATRASQVLADKLGPYARWEDNQLHQETVITQQHNAASKLTWARDEALGAWANVWAMNPIRNAQLSVIAPTGTISLLMDCETTGIEPVLAIEAEKTLAGSGSMDYSVTECVARGLERLGIAPEEAAREVRTNPVFATAIGDNVVSPMGHVLMMAAVQPFVSGAISKTVNLPATATVEDVESIYLAAWEHGCKAIAIFRDGCKAYQPVEAKKSTTEAPRGTVVDERERGYRKRPPATRHGETKKFTIGDMEYYVTVNRYPDDGKPCEVFINANTYGTTEAGWSKAAAVAISYALQYGATWEDLREKFAYMNFTPSGYVTSDSVVKFADSPIDFIFRAFEAQAREQEAEPQVQAEQPTREGTPVLGKCTSCGSTRLLRTGSCLTCKDCGTTTGCG